MPLASLDHVNIRTTNLSAMIDWYECVLGLVSGPRPEFPFGGAWLYLGKQATVHLVDVSEQPAAGGNITLEHFAFRATDMPAMLSRLDERGEAYSIDPVPDLPLVQINLHDPDGNHIHVDFHSSEADTATA